MAVTCVPTAWNSRFDSQPFRILSLRRVWLQFRPCVPAGVACHLTLVAITAQFAPLESAAARVCREAGARVCLNVRVQDAGWRDCR